MKIITRKESYLGIQTTFRPQNPSYKNFNWQCMKNESRKSYLGEKEQKQCFQLFLDRTHILVLHASFLNVQPGAQ